MTEINILKHKRQITRKSARKSIAAQINVSQRIINTIATTTHTDPARNSPAEIVIIKIQKHQLFHITETSRNRPRKFVTAQIKIHQLTAFRIQMHWVLNIIPPIKKFI